MIILISVSNLMLQQLFPESTLVNTLISGLANLLHIP